MPLAAPIACSQCGKLTRHRHDQRGGSTAQGYGYRWQQARIEYLKQHPLCAEGERQGLVEEAKVVDHIIPHKGDAALFWDEDNNWESLCKRHHDVKTATEQRAGVLTVPTTIVCGPPGSGKTTYVRERQKWGDLVLDLDLLIAALSGQQVYDKPDAILPFAWEARDAVIRKLHQPTKGIRHAWLIMGGAKRAERERFGAEVVMLAVPSDECLRRIALDPTRAERVKLWEPIIRSWWHDYER